MKARKEPVAIVLVASMLLGCVSQPAAMLLCSREEGMGARPEVSSTPMLAQPTPSNYDPCNDPLFLGLAAQPPDSLSAREYEWLVQKQRECAQFNALSHMSRPRRDRSTRLPDETDNPCNDPVLIALRTKPLDKLSDGEYALLMQKEYECAQFYSLAPRPDGPEQPRASLPAQFSNNDGKWDCTKWGRSDASRLSTTGSFFGGFVGGLMGQLPGTLLAVVVQRRPEPPTSSLIVITDPECRLAYEDAYGDKGKSKKKMAALGGGVVGTAIAFAIVIAYVSLED